MNKLEFAGMLDHTLLKADASPADILRLCSEAKENGFKSVCVNPVYVQVAHMLLTGTKVKVCTVVGFPLGANTTHVKVLEAREALGRGAEEIDMVINIGALKNKDYQTVLEDIRRVVDEARQWPGTLVKVIIETALLIEEEKVKACELAVQAGADFVKTSTGFAGGGATVEDVKLMRQTVGPKIGVKASGGIKTLPDAIAMFKAGANRIGSSSGMTILQEIAE